MFGYYTHFTSTDLSRKSIFKMGVGVAFLKLPPVFLAFLVAPLSRARAPTLSRAPVPVSRLAWLHLCTFAHTLHLCPLHVSKMNRHFYTLPNLSPKISTPHKLQ